MCLSLIYACLIMRHARVYSMHMSLLASYNNSRFLLQEFILNKQIVVVLFLLVVGIQSVHAGEDYLASIAKVRVATYDYDVESPWYRGSGGEFSGSAVLIDGRRLLTNAHVLTQASRIEVKRGDSNRWYKAYIQHVSDASDLATLTVNDASFYEGAKPVAMGNGIKLGSEVRVIGFPIGGESVSFTQGILSRIEVSSYTNSAMYNLLYQLDAAINAGNSGGPVFHKGKLVGISSQGIDDADNIGYAIPVPVINQFLTDIADGRVDGVPVLPFNLQRIANGTQREFYGTGDGSGQRLAQVAGPESGQCLRSGDGVVAIDVLKIGPNGMVELPGSLFVPIDYIAARKQLGESVVYTVVSNGKSADVSCQLSWNWKSVWQVIPVRFDYRPKWIEVGGIILVEMTDELYQFFADYEVEVDGYVEDIQVELQPRDTADPERKLFVVNVLPHDANEGYDVQKFILTSFNGSPVHNLADLKQQMKANDSTWVDLEFHQGTKAVFKRDAVKVISEEVQEEYGF